MVLKSKISTSYYVIFLVVLPAILILFTMMYFKYISLGPGMILIVFSLPVLFLPFVFEYYIFDGTDLKVKNILGITIKKVAFSDYEEIYGLDKTHGRYALTSTAFYIVDKKERVLSLKSYYCQNLEEFIPKLSKGKILREDRAQLHALKMQARNYFLCVIFLMVFMLFLTTGLIRDVISSDSLNKVHGLFFLVWGCMFWLIYEVSKMVKEDYTAYKVAKQKVTDRTIRLSKMDKRFKYKS